MKKVRIIAFVLAAVMLFSLCACRKDDQTDETTAPETTEAPETKAPETEPVTEAPETDPSTGEPEYINPLTGLAAGVDVNNRRPVAIMVNNVKASLPQSGISKADILFECLAEGGITRLMMLSTEYEFLPKVGSVRSARDYYIDFADGFDSIFVHAGGSTYAYDTLASRNTDHIDGVNGPSPKGTFARDAERLAAGVASEHTLFMQGGEALKAAIDSLKYRTEKEEDAEAPMVFKPWDEVTTLGSTATHIGVNVSNYQYVDYVYDEATSTYLRYQYHGDKHMDCDTETQLSFTNVILMFNDSGIINGDEKNRLWMDTTGEGEGYYITNGTYASIKWEKETTDSPIKYYYEDGTEVEFNRGKTMINVVNKANMDEVVFDDNTDSFEK